MPVLERREAGDVLVLDVVALGAELCDGSVPVAGVPQGDGVEDEAEGGELVLSERAGLIRTSLIFNPMGCWPVAECG